MRYFVTIFLLLCLTVVSLAGLRGAFSRKAPIEVFSDMVRQPKVQPQTPNEFFPDKMSSRSPPQGTVSQAPAFEIDGQALLFNGKPVYPGDESPVNTGRVAGTTNWIELSPIPLSSAFLNRGRDRYQIFCTPCHGADGDGRGLTKRYNMVAMANFHDRRLIEMADGEMFDTITHGKTLMGAYGSALAVADRWAVIAYIRALQRSHLGTLEDVPETSRSRFKK